MAITIIKKPAKLILAKQPVAFTADSTNAGTPLRIKANIAGNTDADSVAADNSGQAEFELSDYLQGLISERHKTLNVPSLYANHPAMVQFEFRELIGSPPVVGDTIVSDPFYVLDGYIPHARRKALYADYTSLLAYLVDTKNFLSWHPANKPKSVLPGQKEFLNYLQLYSQLPITIYISVLLNFTNGDDADMIGVFPNIPDVAYMQMLYIPTGYTQLGIAAFMAANYPDKTLENYVVYLGTGIYSISEYQKYVVDFRYYENPRFLYLKNPFGLLEIVRFTGRGEQTNEISFEIARTDGRIIPDRIAWKHERTDSVKVNTGFLEKEQMQMLSEMDFSVAYELQGDALQAIVFETVKLPVLHDTVYQYEAELEYKYAYTKTAEQA